MEYIPTINQGRLCPYITAFPICLLLVRQANCLATQFLFPSNDFKSSLEVRSDGIFILIQVDRNSIRFLTTS